MDKKGHNYANRDHNVNIEDIIYTGAYFGLKMEKGLVFWNGAKKP
jgi:hypothetical protein